MLEISLTKWKTHGKTIATGNISSIFRIRKGQQAGIPTKIHLLSVNFTLTNIPIAVEGYGGNPKNLYNANNT